MVGSVTDPSVKTMNDSTLVRALAEGNEGAVGELYDRYAPLLLGLARRILGSSEDAEEVLQEAFLQAWERAPRYDPQRSSVSTWLALLARSRAIDRLRTRRVVDRTEAAAFREDPRAHASAEGTSRVLEDERRQRVRNELIALPPEQREVLEMAFYGGLTQREIAARTATPLGTVKTRTLLAMKKLRKSLRDEIRELL